MELKVSVVLWILLSLQLQIFVCVLFILKNVRNAIIYCNFLSNHAYNFHVVYMGDSLKKCLFFLCNFR